MTLAAAAWALTPCLGLLVAVAVHVALSRGRAGMPRPRALGLSALAGLAVVAVLSVSFARVGGAGDPLGLAAAWLLAYLSLAYFYVFGFYNLGESARRIRLLIELDQAGPRGLRLEEILAAYNARLIVEARLQRLLAGGQIVERGGRYLIGAPVGLWAARGLALAKLVLLGARSEFGERGSAASQVAEPR